MCALPTVKQYISRLPDIKSDIQEKYAASDESECIYVRAYVLLWVCSMHTSLYGWRYTCGAWCLVSCVWCGMRHGAVQCSVVGCGMVWCICMTTMHWSCQCRYPVKTSPCNMSVKHAMYVACECMYRVRVCYKYVSPGYHAVWCIYVYK